MHPKIIQSYSPPTNEELIEASSQLHCMLPNQYIEFLMQHNGGRPVPDTVRGDCDVLKVFYFNHIGIRYNGDKREYHYNTATQTLSNLRESPYPDFDASQYIVIASDVCNNLFLLDVSTADGGVYYWMYDQGEVQFVSKSLDDFLSSFLNNDVDNSHQT